MRTDISFSRLLKFFGAITGFFCFLTPVVQAETVDINQARVHLEKAIEVEIEAQKEADQWSQEKEGFIAEIRQTKTRLAWVEYQNMKYAAYIENERTTIAELKRKKEEMDKLRRQLEPYLDTVIGRLEKFITQDMNFLEEERNQRLSFLKSAVNDYHLSMSDKLNRVLEALAVEAEYGRSLEVTPETLSVGGRDIEVEILRIGRIALFYRSFDGHHVGRLNPENNQWEALSSKFQGVIGDTIDMVSQKKAVEIVDLPIGGIK